MAHTEGEKELVLGNKQLISLFFVIVALCGVCLALGYMMGRPSGKQLAAIPNTSAASAPGGTVSPIPATSQDSTQAEPPRETAPADAQPAPADAQPQPPSTHTQAAHDVPPAAAPTAVPAPAAGPTPAPREEGATYLQVRALGRADAANLVKTLKEQNFPAVLAESSKPDLFRVLVGPYHQTADVADAKARLKALGFADAFVQK
jgi:cell division septation protein DedD